MATNKKESSGNVELFVETIVEKEGKEIIHRVEKANSFVKGFVRHLSAYLTTDAYVDGFIDTSGAANWVSAGADFTQTALAPSGNDNYGVLVGTSSQTVSQDQYNLVAKISHGTTSGKLSYGETTYSVSDTSLTMTITITRMFDNLSGGDITVNEVGLFVKYTVGSDTKYAMIARDVITATTIPNGGRLTVRYIIQVNP